MLVLLCGLGSCPCEWQLPLNRKKKSPPCAWRPLPEDHRYGSTCVKPQMEPRPRPCIPQLRRSWFMSSSCILAERLESELRQPMLTGLAYSQPLSQRLWLWSWIFLHDFDSNKKLLVLVQASVASKRFTRWRSVLCKAQIISMVFKVVPCTCCICFCLFQELGFHSSIETVLPLLQDNTYCPMSFSSVPGVSETIV